MYELMGYQLSLRRRQGLPLHRGGLKGLVRRNEGEGHMGLAIVTGMSKDKSTCIKDQSKEWTKIKGKGERVNRSCKTAGLTSHVSTTKQGERERQLSKEILKAKHGVETSSMNWSLFPGATARLV